MIPEAFDYVRPPTLDDAVDVLAAAGDDAKVIAGGQSLVPVLRLRLAAPTVLVDIGRISDLRGVREDGDHLVIGATTTHHEILHDPLIAGYAPLIAQATATVADRQVRHLGTFGGSLAHADPAGDLPAVAVALDAELDIAGPHGRRTVAAGDFFVDYLTTALSPDEVLTAVRVPKLVGWGTHYEKFSRVAQAWALVGVAAAIERGDGTITGARIALTNMGPTPVRARAVEQALLGAQATAEAIAEAAALAGEGTRPGSDLSSSAEYRAHLATVLTGRAVSAAGGF